MSNKIFLLSNSSAKLKATRRFFGPGVQALEAPGSYNEAAGEHNVPIGVSKIEATMKARVRYALPHVNVGDLLLVVETGLIPRKEYFFELTLSSGVPVTKEIKLGQDFSLESYGACGCAYPEDFSQHLSPILNPDTSIIDVALKYYQKTSEERLEDLRNKDILSYATDGKFSRFQCVEQSLLELLHHHYQVLGLLMKANIS